MKKKAKQIRLIKKASSCPVPSVQLHSFQKMTSAVDVDGIVIQAGAPKKQKLERKNGYDTNNDLNQLLTQCLMCTVKDRTREAILSAVISAITYVEVHCDMDNYQGAQVDGHSVADALLLVRDELRGKDLEVRHDPPAGTSP